MTLSFPRLFLIVTCLLFGSIGVVGLFKNKSEKKGSEVIAVKEKPSLEVAKVEVIESPLSKEIVRERAPEKVEVVAPQPAINPVKTQEVKKSNLPETDDKIRRFFTKGSDKLPIVDTVTYTSRVSWLKGRPAWIADYASHFNTSRHFIARSLNGKVDYITQKVSPGDKFNILSPEKNFEFYLLVDLSKCQMHFYYLDFDQEERVLIKSYNVGLGRKSPNSPSGSLTPTGKYRLGEKIAVYKPGVQGYFQNQRVEMIQVFGSRWLPFEEEIENCSDSAKGYGIHGVPCQYDEEHDVLVEDDAGVGVHNSDGCIRLRRDDIEELFSIVISRPTVIEIVKDMNDVVLPMKKEGQV